MCCFSRSIHIAKTFDCRWLRHVRHKRGNPCLFWVQNSFDYDWEVSSHSEVSISTMSRNTALNDSNAPCCMKKIFPWLWELCSQLLKPREDLSSMVNGKEGFSAECQNVENLSARMCCLQCDEQKLIWTFFCNEHTRGYWAFIIFPSVPTLLSQVFWNNLFACLSSPLFSVSNQHFFVLLFLVTRSFSSFKKLLFCAVEKIRPEFWK